MQGDTAAGAPPSEQTPAEPQPSGAAPGPVLTEGVAMSAAGVDTVGAVGLAADDAAKPSTSLGLANEALPAEPPEPGTEAPGTIPAARARLVWARAHVANWRLFLVRFLSAGLAVVLTVVLLPGLGFVSWRWAQGLMIALVFGVLNATVKPLLQFLVLRFIVSTYGIVVVVINALLLVLLAAIMPGTFVAHRTVAVLAGGALVGVLGLFFETMLGASPPVLDRDYLDRNGLS